VEVDVVVVEVDVVVVEVDVVVEVAVTAGVVEEMGDVVLVCPSQAARANDRIIRVIMERIFDFMVFTSLSLSYNFIIDPSIKYTG